MHNERIIQEHDYQKVEATLDAGYYVLLYQLRIPFPLHLTSSHSPFHIQLEYQGLCEACPK